MTEKTQELIIKIREVCAERNLNSTGLMRLMEEHPDYGTNKLPAISKSTVDAILNDNTRTPGLKFSTIQPLANILLDIPEDTKRSAVTPDEYDAEKSREYFAEREALRQMILLKSAEEERLRTRLEALELESDEELRRITEYQAKTIAVLEQNNIFLQQTIEIVRQSLHDERESKKRLYTDLKERMKQIDDITARIAVLESYQKKD